MELNKTTLDSIVEKLCISDDLKISDIPEIELYMDQLLRFLTQKLDVLKRDPKDKILTKTMINNYTKDQLLIPPHNKKYTKEHIMLLIVIYHLKNILSINDIKRLFRPILNDINTSEDDVIPLGEIYTTFLDLKREQFNEFCDHFAEKFAYITKKSAVIDNQNNRDVAELFLTVLMLIAQANAAKRLAEKIIDDYFPALDAAAEQNALLSTPEHPLFGVNAEKT